MPSAQLFLFIALTVFLDAVAGVCFCPTVFISYDGYVYRPSACNDMESAQECEKANWEISDMQSSLGSLANIFLEDAISKNNMTMLQAAYARSLLSMALEDDKPEGDCANGLLTEIRIKDALAKCFSPELLLQCAIVRDKVGDYQDSIPTKLEHFLGNSTMMYNGNTTFFDRSLELEFIDTDRIVIHPSLADFIEVVRFRSSIRTARIRCASFEATTEEIAQAGAFGLSTSTALFLALLSATSTIWL